MPFNIGPGELIIVLLIAAIFGVPILIAMLLVSRGTRPVQPWTGPGTAAPDPRAVLADRLARGEISRAEFDTAMLALGYVDRPG